MREGWWKFHRKMFEHPYAQKPAYMWVWCWLLSEAQFQEGKKIVFKGKVISLQTGQLTCGAKQISSATGVPRGTVERIIKTLKNEEQIEVQTDSQKSLITVKKWNEYQNVEEVNEERMRNDRGTDEERMRTTEELKNEIIEELKNNTLQPQASADNIKKIFEIFQMTVNPTINYGNKTQRKAAQDLLDTLGEDKALRLAEYACSIQNEDFAPVVTTPYQLKEKAAQVRIHWQKNNNKQGNVVFIS